MSTQEIKRAIEILDLKTGTHMRTAKAFYIKGLISVLHDVQLVDALAEINLDLIALDICSTYSNLSLVTFAARQQGKQYGKDWLVK